MITVLGVDSSERQTAIVRELQGRGRVEVGQLASALATSEVTVRRDLEELAETGVLRRVRGGAVSLLMRGQELPFAMREIEAVVAKEHIARTATALIRDGDAVVLDGGTTALAVARALAGRQVTVTVMALSLQAAGVLSANPHVTLMLPGGTARPGELVLSGPLTEASLAGLRFDTAILGCCGIGPGGLSTHELTDAAVMRAAMASSTRTIVLADGAKFTRTAMAVVCPLERIDIVVTDPSAPATATATLRHSGVDVAGLEAADVEAPNGD